MVTKYDTSEHVHFGKEECAWVNFVDFWLTKLPALGWVKIAEVEKFTAIGMIGRPEAITYLITPTDKGHDVREAYWKRLSKIKI